MTQGHKSNGFTLVELMLAMTFIAVLLVAIAMLTINMSNTYTKGITLRQVNQSGLVVSEELQRSIAATTPFEVSSVTGQPSKYMIRDNGGRLCTGQYSYAWNYGKNISPAGGTSGLLNKYTDHSDTVIRFVKVVDSTGSICTNPLEEAIDPAKATELLASGDRDLAMYNFTIRQSAASPTTGQALYAIDFLLGTNTTDQIVDTTGGDAACKPPSESKGNENFCAINKFSIITRAGNLSGGI